MSESTYYVLKWNGNFFLRISISIILNENISHALCYVYGNIHNFLWISEKKESYFHIH